MQIKKLLLGIPVFLCGALLVPSSPTLGYAGVEPGRSSVANQENQTVKGPVLGKSQKAGTITINDKQLGLVLIKFDAATTGLEHAEKGEAAVIRYKVVGADKIATEIKAKLATLPAGVTEILPGDLAALIAAEADFALIDSRPDSPYAAGHIPGAISIPVAKLKSDAATLLPRDQDKPLIFYCGGTT
jgi:hypothetical protein